MQYEARDGEQQEECAPAPQCGPELEILAAPLTKCQSCPRSGNNGHYRKSSRLDQDREYRAQRRECAPEQVAAPHRGNGKSTSKRTDGAEEDVYETPSTHESVITRRCK